eukprot:c17525_g1_i1.p1 GENE.c17525_g1_i1~~c17525_g1_i1.p1  ORF type:complete len:368 (-),score=20.79 c17525_g1_i1:41-1144(-)
MSMLCSLSAPSVVKPEVPPVFRTSSAYDSEFETSSWASTPRNHSPSFSPPCEIPSDASPALSSISGSSYSVEEVTFDVVTSACEVLGPWLAYVADKSEAIYRTPFDATSEPKISIAAYIDRIRYYSQASPESTLCGVVLMRRVCMQNNINLSIYNVHRLLIASIMVLAKFYDDEIDSNSRWARIAGLKKNEINNLEIELLNRCQFDLRVSPQDFHDMVFELIDFARHPPKPTPFPSPSSLSISPSPTHSSSPSPSPSSPISVGLPKKVRGHIKIFRSRHEVATGSDAEQPKGLHRTKSIVSFFHIHPHPHLHFQRAISSSMSRFATPDGGLHRPISMHSLSGLISPVSLFQKRSRSKGSNEGSVAAQ